MKFSLIAWGVLGLKPFFPEVEYHRFVTAVGGMGKSRREAKGVIQVVRKFVEKQIGFKPREYSIKDFYETSSNGVWHVYLRQKVNGKEVFNGDMNINIKDDRVVSYGDSFYRSANHTKQGFPRNLSSAPHAMKEFLSQAGIQQKQLIEEEAMDYAGAGLVLKSISESLDSHGRAQLGWVQSQRDGLVPVWDLQVEFQKNYYHAHVSVNHPRMVALADWGSHINHHLITYPTLNFDTKPSSDVINSLHDLFYHYGFDERAGNFQKDNFGRGGLENDAVVIYEQNITNPFFTTPPDGLPPRMHLSDNNQAIIIHEYCHGLSNRLTGGPANSDCLNAGEPAGLGEGWGDFIAILLAANINNTRHSNFATIRTYPYSTNLTTNPDLFSNLNKYREDHAMGQVWAVILYEIYWNLRDKLGFTENWHQPPHVHGNTLMLQLVIDAMKLQPCRPTFIEARDALLQAEQLLTKGIHACDVWNGFAKRGLGLKVTSTRINSFEIPKFCQN